MHAPQEILDSLLPGQKAEDRPDLAARVFKGYMDQMLKELYDVGIMGRHAAHCHVVEFQKRGLPHCHILVILEPADRLRDPEEIDKAVCAELPPNECKLQRQVVQTMIHGPCDSTPSAQCREKCSCDGPCSKGYVVAASALYKKQQLPG